MCQQCRYGCWGRGSRGWSCFPESYSRFAASWQVSSFLFVGWLLLCVYVVHLCLLNSCSILIDVLDCLIKFVCVFSVQNFLCGSKKPIVACRIFNNPCKKTKRSWDSARERWSSARQIWKPFTRRSDTPSLSWNADMTFLNYCPLFIHFFCGLLLLFSFSIA